MILKNLFHRKMRSLLTLKDNLVTLDSGSDLEYTWNIKGHENIMAKARKMIGQAKTCIYLALLPATLQALRPTLEEAIG